MSGASSAFTNGHLTNRQAQIIKRKDLDLSEILNLCAQPLGIDERVDAVRRYSLIYPELKFFLIVAYFCKNAFSQLNAPGDLAYQPSKIPKGGSTETLQSMWREITRMYDTFPSGPKVKRGKAQQLLLSLHKDDAELVSQLLAGKYYRKELNEVVVSKAFPQETPQGPKA